MKSIIAALVILLCSHLLVSGEITLHEHCALHRENTTELDEGYGDVKFIGPALLKIPNPKELKIERVAILGPPDARHGVFRTRIVAALKLDISPEALQMLLTKTARERTTSLAVLLDGKLLGITPRTREWEKFGISIIGHGGSGVSEAEMNKLDKAGVLVIGGSNLNLPPDLPVKAIGPASLQKEGSETSYYPQSIEEHISRGMVFPPYLIDLKWANNIAFNVEPVSMEFCIKNIGIEQSCYPVNFYNFTANRSMIRLLEGGILKPVAAKTFDATEESPIIEEGKSLTTIFNFTRNMNLEYSIGTGCLKAQFKLLVNTAHTFGKHDENTWINLPSPEIKVLAFAEREFKELKRLELTDGELLRMGTYRVATDEVAILVFAKNSVISRILRLEPKVASSEWSLAWDSKKRQAHVLATAARARYWVTATDRLDFDVRLDVPASSKLQAKDGKVTRVE
jgi:hypothetical protein